MKPKKTGRPALAAEDVRSHQVQLRLTDEELELLTRAAKADGRQTSSWIRHYALQVARAQLGLA